MDEVADEIVVDVMKTACGITLADARPMIAEVEIEGVGLRSRLARRRNERPKDGPPGGEVFRPGFAFSSERTGGVER